MTPAAQLAAVIEIIEEMEGTHLAGLSPYQVVTAQPSGIRHNLRGSDTLLKIECQNLLNLV